MPETAKDLPIAVFFKTTPTTVDFRLVGLVPCERDVQAAFSEAGALGFTYGGSFATENGKPSVQVEPGAESAMQHLCEAALKQLVNEKKARS